MRDFIKKEIEKAIGEKDNFSVIVDGRHGDYSSNVAIALKKDPKEITDKIKSNFFEKIEIAGPGFLNFTLSEKGLAEGLKNLSKKSKKKNKKIQVEFISANPTGKLHIGHGRSAFYGDALANVLEKAGYKTEREFFINDSKESTQIKELGKTIIGEGKSYLTDYLSLKIKNQKSKIKNKEEAGYLIAQQIQKDNQKFFEKDLKIKFDNYFSEEKELRKKKEFEKILGLLKKKKMVYEKDGAFWFKTSEFGDDEDRVVLRSDGSVPYFLSDIAYHENKNKRKYNKIIDIWGADHQGHVKRMMATKKIMGWKADLDILISQMVTIKEKGETKKLSKRAGTVILLEDLVKEVGLDACRWFYLEKSLSTHMEFDMTLAKERSMKNPVYYVQYAHARMNSILLKSKYSAHAGELKTINSKSVKNLILKLIQFPEVVEDTANDYQVHRLTQYAYELAKEFSQFYENVRIIGSEDEKELVRLVALTKKVLSDTLKLLGISSPDKM